MTKRTFTTAERFAVWTHHDKRCWLCREPLPFKECTIDHVLPESLLDDPAALLEVLTEYGLPGTFKINGFENWLPSHIFCNQTKSTKAPAFVPGNRAILDRLIADAPKVEGMAKRESQRPAGDKILAKVAIAVEEKSIDLDELKKVARADLVKLDSGYWLAKEDIALEALCRCERNNCVGQNGKVTCLFSQTLAPWVIKTGLFWRCYDEVIECPRCKQMHKRGHIGASWVCGVPFRDQANQTDYI